MGNLKIIFINSLIFSVLIFAVTLNGFAQRKNSYGQNIKMFKADRVIISANYLKWQKLPSEVSLRNINRGFYLGYFLDNPIGGSRFSFGVGFSITSNNLYSDAIPSFIVDTSIFKTDFVKINSLNNGNIDYKSNKMAFTYIGLPIEIRLRLGKDENLKFAAGFELSYLMSSYVKYSGDNLFLKNNEFMKFKYYHIINASHFRYGISFRFGHNRFGFRAFYPLTPVFDLTSGQKIFPVEIGATLMVF